MPKRAARKKGATKRTDPQRKARTAAVKTKRAHRVRLSVKALGHWKKMGEGERLAYLTRVRTALESEGFKPTRFQWRHKGHSFGLVKDFGDHQIHVRVYDDGVVDAEWEIHRRYLQHVWSPRPSAHREVQAIFRKHRIPLGFVNEHYLPKVGASRDRFPQGRHKVAHVVGGAAGVVGGVVAVSVARFVLSRIRRGAPPL